MFGIPDVISPPLRFPISHHPCGLNLPLTARNRKSPRSAAPDSLRSLPFGGTSLRSAAGTSSHQPKCQLLREPGKIILTPSVVGTPQWTVYELLRLLRQGANHGRCSPHRGRTRLGCVVRILESCIVACAALTCTAALAGQGMSVALAVPRLSRPSHVHAGNLWGKGRSYRSPDGVLVATVSPMKSAAAYGGDPSCIIIRNRAGRLLAERNHSLFPNQGLTVVEANWTQDSRFFVYTTEESGGHQPWRHPIFFYSRKRHRFFSLDDEIDGTITETFKLLPPSTLVVQGRYLGRNTPGIRAKFNPKNPDAGEPLLRISLRWLEGRLTRAALSSDENDKRDRAKDRSSG